jgi:hypothetical protein
MGGSPRPPPPPGLAPGARGGREPSPGPTSSKGLVKLHWKEAQHEAPPVPALKRKGTFWSKIQTPQIDTSKLAQLFEQKPKEVAVKVNYSFLNSSKIEIFNKLDSNASENKKRI